ncbi:MAG: hypothetical protein H6835_14465 [Planctomycetes bacterium]|nr:hypothetical protein [Planctomycetota bacterium]
MKNTHLSLPHARLLCATIESAAPAPMAQEREVPTTTGRAPDPGMAPQEVRLADRRIALLFLIT